MLEIADIEDAWSHFGGVAERMLTDPQQASAEKLRRLCRDGRALCLKCADGYIVVQIVTNEHDGAREMSVWFATSLSREHGAYERVLPHVQDAAKQLRCSRIIFNSGRKGWLRKAKGFVCRNIEYVMEIAS